MIKKHLDHFDIQKISNSGQCFRLNLLSENRYGLVAFGQYLEICQNGTEISFSCTEREFETLWKSYFDLETDYGAFGRAVDSEDRYLSAAVNLGLGIRILRQELWEVIVSFIISQQNNIPRIKKCVESLCRNFGEQQVSSAGVPYYTFPRPEVLSGLTPDDLAVCSLGYRSKYICKTARMIAEGQVSLSALPDMGYEEAKSELLKLYGVGVKVAECICLFALHHIDAFPIDTHIQDMLNEHYPSGFPFQRYQGFAGILQQYAFYYELWGKPPLPS